MQNLAVSPDATGLSFIPTIQRKALSTAANPVAAWTNRPVDDSRQWARGHGKREVMAPWYAVDGNGIIREPDGIPEVAEGSITPLARLELHEDAPAIMFSVHIACGLAAAAWMHVAGEASIAGRDAVICLVEEVCRINESNLAETFCIAEHELDPARDRVAVRLAVDPEFTRKFGKALAIMAAGCVYFPWYQEDGRIPS